MIFLRKNKFKNAETESCDSENKSYIEVAGTAIAIYLSMKIEVHILAFISVNPARK